jgi:DNA-binding MarR family transcriptional regulator/GNAT superfamily N-acetyltransferase
MDSPVAEVRAFTRFYTAVIGVLDEGLLGTPYSVTEARVLFELAQSDATDVADLRRGLRLDSGYMSRIAARLEADGLVTRAPSGRDARRQVLALTPRGREVFADLDARSADQVAHLLDKLGEADQERLVTAMGTVRSLLGAAQGDGLPATARTVVLREPGPGDLGWVVARHGSVYAAEYGWNAEFEGLVARIVADYAAAHDPRREAAWIAELDGEPVGCVFCVARDDTTAQLRILLVDPAARGLGIGAGLVAECLRFATAAGYESMMLWTNDVLTSARRIYEAAGFRLVDEEPHHSFGQDLVGQVWERRLEAGG